MRFGGRRIIDSDITSMDGEPVQPVNALGSIFNRPHGDKGKTSRPPGSLIIHDNNLFNFSMSAEFILKVPFGRADRQTKYSQDVCRFYFGENEWGLRWRFGGNGVPASRIWRRGWSYSIGVESHQFVPFAALRIIFINTFLKISFPVENWRSLWKWKACSWRIDDVARIWRVVLPRPWRRWYIGCGKSHQNEIRPCNGVVAPTFRNIHVAQGRWQW